MKKVVYTLCFAMIVLSCSNKKQIPDVSSIKVDLKIQRFEKDFYSVDTNQLDKSLQILYQKYPEFLQDYIYNIQAWEPHTDSVLKYCKFFIRDSFYQSMYRYAQEKFKSMDDIKGQVELGLKYVKYYYPKYKTPTTITTFIGPLEGTGNALTNSGFAIGLQSYLGKDFPAYHTSYIADVYPEYKSRRFEPQYIAVNCMWNIINDMYPQKNTGRPLIEQMIEAGKRYYLLDAFLPTTADTLKMGYTAKQLKGCYDNEKGIWAFFIQNNLLYETELNLIGQFVNDGPNTPEISQEAPGFIGQFIGWQIVKKWMDKNDKKTLDELMQTPSKQIFDEAKYKP